MPRSMSPALENIFAEQSRKIEYLLDLTFPSITALRFATGELQKSLIDYENRVESVKEIRQTIETPIDRVNLSLSNKDLFFDDHLTENFGEWQKCEAVLYRRYFSGDASVSEDREVFRGAAQNPDTEDADYTFSFQIIPDTISKGQIVADRTLAPPCSFVFKDPQTCGYTGPEAFCDHLLLGNCTDYGWTHRFGGTQSRYKNKTSAPGSAGNPDPNGGPVSACPALDQYVLSVSKNGEHEAILAALVTEGDLLLNPVTNQFERVKRAIVVENTEVYEVVFANGTITKGSGSHPLIENPADRVGRAITKNRTGDTNLTWTGGALAESKIVSITPKRRQAVMKIETDGPTHIYASGAAADKMAVCHNAKIIGNENQY